MKKALITGASGFLGKYLLQSCVEQGFEPITVGRSLSNSIPCDLSKQVPEISDNDFDKVIFAAGKAHFIPKTEAERKEFFEVNVQGLKNFLSSIHEKKIKQLIFISTVAVYGCEEGENISEENQLQASDPYGLSKIEAEEFATQWANLRQIPLLIFRLPLVAGKNPSGNLGAIIHGLKKGHYFKIGPGTNRKSIVLAQDVADFCLKIPLNKKGIFHLTDGNHPTFSQIDEHIARQLNLGKISSLPFWGVKILAKLGDFLGKKFPLNSHRLSKMTSTLTFSSDKAKREIDWNPRNTIETNYL